jgi:hypothetical protein
VPWRRLMTEWVVVTLVLIVVMALFLDAEPAAYSSLLVGGVVYLGVGFVLAKIGYQRTTVRSLRDHQRASATTNAPAARPRPAPTKRTGGGTSRSPKKRR